MKHLAALAVLVLVLASACGGDSNGSETEGGGGAEGTAPEDATPTIPSATKPTSPAEIVVRFAKQSLPIQDGSLQIETAETDTSIGRLGGYAEKASWRDDRITERQRFDTLTKTDGDIILFYSEADAKNYMELRKAAASSPLSAVGYMAQDGKFLLTLGKVFTPQQADEYIAEFHRQLSFKD